MAAGDEGARIAASGRELGGGTRVLAPDAGFAVAPLVDATAAMVVAALVTTARASVVRGAVGCAAGAVGFAVKGDCVLGGAAD